MRVIDWGEKAVFKASWCWWAGKGWRDLSGFNSIQCHITAQLNHLLSCVEQVIMSLPVGPESITRWMWPLQTYRAILPGSYMWSKCFHSFRYLKDLKNLNFQVPVVLYRPCWIWEQNSLFWICTGRQFGTQYHGSRERSAEILFLPKS